MAESQEHKDLSQTFLSLLNDFSRSELYSYRERERGKFDFACSLSENWQCLLDGQTLWKHPEGVDKDLRTLLITSDAPLVVYIVRDTKKHRSAFAEIRSDYQRNDNDKRPKYLKDIWIPQNFDADSEEAQQTVRSLLRKEIIEGILFNVLFGRLNASRVRATLLTGGFQGREARYQGLELAILHALAVDGFTSLRHMSQKMGISSNTLRDRIQRLQMSGLILQERGAGQGYHVGSAGRAFLRLCEQVYRIWHGGQLRVETVDILKMLEIEPDEDIPTSARDISSTPPNSPKAMFYVMLVKTYMAAHQWNVSWDRSDYSYIPDEHDTARWLVL